MPRAVHEKEARSRRVVYERRALALGCVVLGFALAASVSLGCVDGVTPNCEDASVCAPSMGELPRDASTDQATAADTGGNAPDASSDAGPDGDGG